MRPSRTRFLCPTSVLLPSTGFKLGLCSTAVYCLLTRPVFSRVLTAVFSRVLTAVFSRQCRPRTKCLGGAPKKSVLGEIIIICANTHTVAPPGRQI